MGLDRGTMGPMPGSGPRIDRFSLKDVVHGNRHRSHALNPIVSIRTISGGRTTVAGYQRAGISWVLAMTLAFGPMASVRAAPLTRTDYEACQARDETNFRNAIDAITANALRHELKTVDYDGVVAIEWRQLKLDALIDRRVDQAVSAVRDENSWGSLLQSLASQEQAQKLATAVAERVYQSDDMRKAIEALAVGVGREVGGRIELASQDATAPALDCLKAFIGPRYGTMISGAVTTDAGAGLEMSSKNAGPNIGAGAVLRNSTSGITGVTLLIVRRQMANMARRIGQRIAGSVLSRLVSVVAGGVGLVLIAKDVWDLRHGVLPIIADEMKSKDTKDKVRAEVSRTISSHINDHLGEISRGTADQIVALWRKFKSAHSKALDLAERKPGFRGFLDNLKPDQLAQMDEVVSLVLENEGEPGVLKRLGDGTLETAVKRLPAEALTVARETRSVEEALRWNAIAGDQLFSVLKYELHQRAKPESFSQTSLRQLLALEDRLAIVRLAGLEKSARDTLFDMDALELKRLARSLTGSELATLASYLTGLKATSRKQVLAAVGENPARIIPLKSAAVRDALLASADQQAAINMLLRDGSGTVSEIRNDFQLAWDGRIAPRLILAKHPLVLALIAFGLFVVLLIFRRLVRPRGGPAESTQTS